MDRSSIARITGQQSTSANALGAVSLLRVVRRRSGTQESAAPRCCISIGAASLEASEACEPPKGSDRQARARVERRDTDEATDFMLMLRRTVTVVRCSYRMILGSIDLQPHADVMNGHRSNWLTELLILGVWFSGGAFEIQGATADPGWPRRYSNGTASLVVYQPQVDSWSDFKTLTGRCAVALTEVGGREPVYGTFRFEGDTLVDTTQRIVLMRNIRAADMRFPGAPGGRSSQLADLTRKLLPSEALVISLDRILAFVEASRVPRKEAVVRTDPPPIFVSTKPAVLVILDGEPVMVDVANTNLRRIVNTNWKIYLERITNRYYLCDKKFWLVATDLHGEFTPTTGLPPDFLRLPADEFAEVREALPIPAAWTGPPPRVIVVNEPAELIVIRGAPELTPIAGTQLLHVSNTDSDLFVHAVNRSYYFLTSGRWFRAATLEGPWQYASPTLPADFKRIPPDHSRAHVLAAVPGTREAEDAVLIASIPRTAEVNRNEAKAEVQYVGAPEFVPISGTSITYAKNTPNDVFRIGDSYYLCLQGVWFVSNNANGPWKAADKIPREIYSIPESSPKYNVTYVKIYESTPTTIVVGYTPGYYGAYVSGGVVVWGTGYYYPPYVAVGVAPVPVYWGASYYTYGASAWYNPATGVYARGSAVYGPYGGYGAGAAYNPRTGTYAQGAGVWGPNGGAAVGRTYNPITGTYSAGYKAANPYGSWGEGVVGNGSNWARGGYQSTSRGTVAAGQTSMGGSGVAVQGAGGNSGYLAKSGSGDLYAGANGNVYKRDNGQWYQNQNGSWNAMNKSDVSAQHQQAAARDRGALNAQMSERRQAMGGGLRGQGVEQRPRLQGGRRR